MLALQTVALETPEIFGLVQERIWVNEIPLDVIEDADTHKPPKMLVLRMAGGGLKSDMLPLVDRTFIANCYGETDFEAELVLQAVEQRFVFLSREFVAGVLIHHINPTGGPLPNVEPDLVWPILSQSFTTKADVFDLPPEVP